MSSLGLEANMSLTNVFNRIENIPVGVDRKDALVEAFQFIAEEWNGEGNLITPQTIARTIELIQTLAIPKAQLLEAGETLISRLTSQQNANPHLISRYVPLIVAINTVAELPASGGRRKTRKQRRRRGTRRFQK